MKERWIKIQTALIVLVLVAFGVVEYIQLMNAFDLPQVMLVMPVTGAVSVIVLKKFSFLVPVGTALLACMYQIVAGDSNAITYLQTNAGSVLRILAYVLPICLLFMLLGMGGGALIRVLINRKKKIAVGVVCLIAGLVIIFTPYLFVFGNPLYPIQARIRLNRYAEENFTDDEITEKRIYFSMQTSDYQCRVFMSDGVLHQIGIDENGDVTEG
ncbi:MAG: hypothetical protein J1F22_01300 [Lachnospiraceae bacterium]|nr:hypothetical protein [Lachnospiraceae bacterium]